MTKRKETPKFVFRTCLNPNCQKGFCVPDNNPDQKYCRKTCEKHHQVILTHDIRPERKRTKVYPPATAKGSAGIMSELVVACDLMKRGWEVFKAFNTQSPCDLIAMQDKVLLRIEVKTKNRNKMDIKEYTMPAKLNEDNFDILALVLPDRVVYTPEPSSFI